MLSGAGTSAVVVAQFNLLMSNCKHTTDDTKVIFFRGNKAIVKCACGEYFQGKASEAPRWVEIRINQEISVIEDLITKVITGKL